MTASGAQIEIVHGSHRAVVTELGATLRSYELDGRAVLDGFDADEMRPACHGQVLAPWPNRIADGRYTAPDGTAQQLPLTEPDRLCALHGLVGWLPWRVAARHAESVQLECELWPQTGYPFHLRMAVSYELDAGGLRCTMSATNAGIAPAPYAVGHHPYFACGGRVDDALLRLPARAVLEADERLIPTGRALPVAGTAYDFTSERRLGATGLDHCFAELDADADGVYRASISDGATWRTTVWMRPPLRWLMVFTSDTLAAPRRRRAVAIEPMSAPPNAFQSGVDVAILAPGETHTATWGVTPETL